MNFQIKRILSLLLVIALLVPCFVISASAAELPQMIDVLQYGGINGTSDLFFSVYKTGTASFTIPTTAVYYVDMLVQVTGPYSDLSVSLRGIELNAIKIDGNHYRFYGNLGGLKFNTLDFDFTVANDTGHITFLSLKVAPAQMDGYTVSATYAVNSSNGDYINGNFSGSSTALFNIDNKSNYPASVAMSVRVSSESWRKYDSLRLFMTTGSQSSFDGLIVEIGNISAPVSYSFISNGGNGEEAFWYEIVVDLTNVNRTLNSDLVFCIYFTSPALSNKRVALYTLTGYLFYDSIDPLFFYFRNVISSVETGFRNVSAWITGQTDTLVSVLQSIFQKDTVQSDQFQDDVFQKGEQLGDISGALEGVNKPNIDSLNPDLSHIVSGDDVQQSTSFFAVILSNDIIFKMFFMALTLALVAYVLYGKR